MTNYIAIDGNLTEAPEWRVTPSGKAVANFTLVHNERRYNSQTNQWEDGEAVFTDVALWGKKGENLVNELAGGKRPVLVLGKLVQDHWQDKETGKKRSKHKIIANDVTLLPASQQQSQQSSAQDAWNQAAQAGQTATPGGFGQQQEPPF